MGVLKGGDILDPVAAQAHRLQTVEFFQAENTAHLGVFNAELGDVRAKIHPAQLHRIDQGAEADVAFRQGRAQRAHGLCGQPLVPLQGESGELSQSEQVLQVFVCQAGVLQAQALQLTELSKP